jgi:hypothetical protein
MKVAFNSPIFYLNVILIVGICFMFDLSLFTFNMNFTQSLTHTLRKIISQTNGKLEKSGLPADIQDLLKPYENEDPNEKEGDNSVTRNKKLENKVNAVSVVDYNLPSENLKMNNFLDQSSKICLKDVNFN